MKRTLAAGLLTVLSAAALPFVAARAQVPEDVPFASTPGRETEPVVLTGGTFERWAALADVNARRPGTDGARCPEAIEDEIPNLLHDEESCTHNRYEDPDVSSSDATNEGGPEGVPVDRLLGYRWTGEDFEQIPLQVDEMAVRYLSNNNSGFAFYSETDQHTTYVFDREGFRWADDYGVERPEDPLAPCIAKPDSEVAADPVQGLDTDDEIVFMNRDTGARAPATAPMPEGIDSSYEVVVTDPFTQSASFAYVMLSGEDGPEPAFDASNGYVRYGRDDAEDENLFLFSQSSYDGYGAAPEGAWYDPATGICHSDEDEWRQRRPSDAATIATPRYRFRYDGRWLMTKLEVNNADEGDAMTPTGEEAYGPDLIDQWKARAFQQRPDGQTPCCGFEEEVNNWGGSSILMGERSGPVRTIRETWGADSGTNVVRREIFYRDEIRFGTFLRVHVIPPLDGIYAQWDYNLGQVETYYNPFNPSGVPIDGQDDEAVGNDRVHVGDDGITYNGQGTPGTSEGCASDFCIDNDIDSPDPTFSGVNAGLNWEVVAGDNGTLVWRNALKHVTLGAAQSAFAVPYYRDDSRFDDGTGNNPGPHMHGRGVDRGEQYENYTAEDGTRQPREHWAPDDDVPSAPGFSDPRFYQGSIGTHGIHILLIAESDNAGVTVPLTEIDSEWRSVVLTGDRGNVGERYGRASEKPLVARAVPDDRDHATDATPTPSGTTSPSGTPSSTISQSATPTTTPTKSSTPTNGSSATTGSSSSRPPSSSPTAAGAQPGRVETSIAASRNVVRYVKGFKLDGRLAGPRDCVGARIVNISRRKHGTTSLEHVDSAVSGQDGSWSIEFRAHANASYVATPASDAACEGSESTPVTVLVRAKLKAEPKGRCRRGTTITGSVRPSSPGSTVRIERRQHVRWVKLSFSEVSRSSRFRLDAPGCGRYRIRWLDNDPTNAPASLELRLRR